MSLLSDSEGSGDDVKVERLKVNAKFADRFEKSERVKDLHRAKELAKRGAFDENEESDSESETEDEDAELLSTGLDLKIIQTINSLRKKDPKIYDQSTKWFDPRNSSDSDSDDEDAAPKVSKKKKFKDVIREQLLESEAAGGLGNGDGIETATRGVRDTASRNTLVYDAEQEKIRQAFIKSAGGKDSKKSKRASDSSDEEDDILQVKSKTPQELKAEEAELKMALKEMRELTAKNSKEDKEKAKPASKSKTAILETEEADGGDSFLVNYLEKGLWKEKASKSRRKAESESEEDIEEDEAELEQMDRFESKYNFRFEELADQQARNGGAEVSGLTEVTGHARDVQGSMRRVDDKRKTQRESRKERKEKERRQQEAELRRLKNLKRQELTERLKQIGQMSGLLDEDEGEDVGKSLKLNEDFLDEDWDPEKHEALMAAQFGDDYYGEEDADFNVADMADIEAYEEYLNGDDIAGDDGYDYDDGEEEGEGEQPAYENIMPKGLKGKAREEYKKNAASMADELYQLDYEDIVAGLPCRFKYKQVEKEGFGLTAEDILLADDSELNKYVSLKKISAYSTGSGVTDGDLSKKRKRLRENVKERLAKEAEEAEAKGLQVKGTKPKAKGAAAVAAVVAEAEEEPEESYPGDGGEDGDKKRKRKRRKGTGNAASAVEVADVSAPVRDTRPESSASKPKPSAEAREAAKAAEKAQEKANSKEKKKVKAKKSSRKKEESEMDKRLGLYN